MKKLSQLMAVVVVASLFITYGGVRAAPTSASGNAGNPRPARHQEIRPDVIAASPLAAFPGAEGFGANAVGGRGGKALEVTNLNDSGPGSLRSCVEAAGARTCVFKTGGLITLNTPLTIRNPYITIAGQTAPGGGITIRTAAGGDVFTTKASEVIMRYISLRPGPGGSNHGNQIASAGATLQDIMIDHATISWGVDSDIETWYRVVNATVQWSIISEALDCSTHPKGCHSKGIMIGGYAGSETKNTKGSENISVHHNLIAQDGERGPLMEVCGTAQVINNVTYNPYWTFAHQQDNCIVPQGSSPYVSLINWIGNYHKKGPDSTSNTDLKVIPADSGAYSGGAQVYVHGNIGPSRTSDSQPDSDWVDPGSRQFIVTTPAPAPAVTTTDARTAYDSVLNDAGNSKGLDCAGNWYSRRDSIDTRVVNDVRNGTGQIIDDPTQVGGWITPAAGSACTDGDHDGMPDVWELKYGLNPNDSSDANADANGNGYTNLEEYLNGRDPGSGPEVTVPVAVSIHGAQIGSYSIPEHNAVSGSYSGMNNGPAQIASTNGQPVLASTRVLYSGSSYSEIMGYPDNTTTGFWFPWYNNAAMNSQFRVSNLGSGATIISVELAGSTIDSFTLPAGAAIRKNYAGKNNGPMHVSSSDAPILATIRVLFGGASFTEMTGFPNDTTTEFWFPWYNNAAMDSQFRVSNLGSVATTITVNLAGSTIDSFTLPAGAAIRKNYPGFNTGPMHVSSSTTPILATIRVLYGSSSFSEMIGFPNNATDEFWFPWYDNVNADSQLRVSNLGGMPTIITVYLAGSAIDSFTEPAGTTIQKNYAGLSGGPLHVISSDGAPILATIRILNGRTSLFELMGYPASSLTKAQWFPWYNNAAMDSQLRIAIP